MSSIRCYPAQSPFLIAKKLQRQLCSWSRKVGLAFCKIHEYSTCLFNDLNLNAAQLPDVADFLCQHPVRDCACSASARQLHVEKHADAGPAPPKKQQKHNSEETQSQARSATHRNRAGSSAWCPVQIGETVLRATSASVLVAPWIF